MLVEVEVTQEDIDKGICFNGAHCPLSRAIGRAMKTKVEVGTHHAHVLGEFQSYLPEEAIRFRRAFDNSEKVEPFSFKLGVPDSYVNSKSNR